jgi:hypothetical protein
MMAHHETVEPQERTFSHGFMSVLNRGPRPQEVHSSYVII